MLHLIGGGLVSTSSSDAIRVRSADRPVLTPALAQAFFRAFDQLHRDQAEAERKAA